MNHLLKLIAMEWNQCTPILHFTNAVSNHHLQSAKSFIAHAKMGAPYEYLWWNPQCGQKLVTLKRRMYAPVSTTLAWQFSLPHHCLAFEILAIQLKHSPRWTNRQSDLNYPSRWTNPSDHCLRIIIDSIQKYLRSVNSSYPSDGTHNYIWPDRNHLIFKRISILKIIHPPISNRLIR